MIPEFTDGRVRARCPNCQGALSTYSFKGDSGEFGSIIINQQHRTQGGQVYSRAVFQLMQCGGCGRGGLALIFCNNATAAGELVDFYPRSITALAIPPDVPNKIEAEFREAEVCASVGATRSAAAMFRSALEKTLKANGYTQGNLKKKIDAAAEDGLITDARKNRAHEDIRVLGNDVLHDDWAAIDGAAVEAAHRYAQRILEDFYDDRETVVGGLQKLGRIPQPPQSDGEAPSS